MRTMTSLDARARQQTAAPITPMTERAVAMGQALARLRRTLREIGTSASNPAPSPVGAMFDLKFALTLERSRRCERPFALTRFADGSGAAASAWAHRFVTEAERHVRTCDAVGLVDGHAVVMWDDSDRAAAIVAAKRLAEVVDIVADVTSTVVFPDDGYTPAALFQALDGSAREAPR